MILNGQQNNIFVYDKLLFTMLINAPLVIKKSDTKFCIYSKCPPPTRSKKKIGRRWAAVGGICLKLNIYWVAKLKPILENKFQ